MAKKTIEKQGARIAYERWGKMARSWPGFCLECIYMVWNFRQPIRWKESNFYRWRPGIMKNLDKDRNGGKVTDSAQFAFRRRDERGFTLVEVLVALVLIISGLIMFAATSGSIMNRNKDSSDKGIAVTLAQDKIEDLKNIARTISLSHGIPTPTTSGSKINPDYVSGAWVSLADEELDSEGNAAAGNLYKRTWNVTAASGEYYLYDIDVDVTWNSGSNTVSLQTQITQ